MRLRVLLEEADALIDVLRVPVDGRHRDAGEVVREEAAGSVVVAVDGAVAAALPVRGAAGEEAQVPRAPRGDAAEDFDDERHHVVVLVVDGVVVVALMEGAVALLALMALVALLTKPMAWTRQCRPSATTPPLRGVSQLSGGSSAKCQTSTCRT